MKKILITGVTGFAGSFLAEHLAATENDAQIFGTYIADKSVENVSRIKNTLQLEKIDLTDFAAVSSLIEKIRPDEIYHLAALPATAASLHNPASFLENNINAELYSLESLVKEKLFTTRVVIVGSGMMYGRVKPEDLPLDENTPLQPTTPYDVSKITQDFMGLQYFNAYAIPIIRARPFNHAGPRLSPDFVISAFAKKIAEIERGKREPVLTVGNVDTKRDITDVHDMVRAYALLMAKGIPGEAYNIGSGKAYKIEDILHILVSLSTTKIEVKVDPQLVRKNDIAELRCDATKIKECTGWQPEVSIDKTVGETLEYWRTVIS